MPAEWVMAGLVDVPAFDILFQIWIKPDFCLLWQTVYMTGYVRTCLCAVCPYSLYMQMEPSLSNQSHCVWSVQYVHPPVSPPCPLWPPLYRVWWLTLSCGWESGLGLEVRLGRSRTALGGGSDIGRRCGEWSPLYPATEWSRDWMMGAWAGCGPTQANTILLI